MYTPVYAYLHVLLSVHLFSLSACQSAWLAVWVFVLLPYISGHLLAEAVSQASQNANEKYQQEKLQWLKHQEKLETQLQELRSKLSQER